MSTSARPVGPSSDLDQPGPARQQMTTRAVQGAPVLDLRAKDGAPFVRNVVRNWPWIGCIRVRSRSGRPAEAERVWTLPHARGRRPDGLAVWGSGVRVPSAPPRPTWDDDTQSSSLRRFRSSRGGSSRRGTYRRRSVVGSGGRQSSVTAGRATLEPALSLWGERSPQRKSGGRWHQPRDPRVQQY